MNIIIQTLFLKSFYLKNCLLQEMDKNNNDHSKMKRILANLQNLLLEIIFLTNLYVRKSTKNYKIFYCIDLKKENSFGDLWNFCLYEKHFKFLKVLFLYLSYLEKGRSIM